MPVVLSFEALLSIIIDLYSNTVHFSILSLSNYHVSSDPLMSRRLIPAVDNDFSTFAFNQPLTFAVCAIHTHTLYSENIIAI